MPPPDRQPPRRPRPQGQPPRSGRPDSPRSGRPNPAGRQRPPAAGSARPPRSAGADAEPRRPRVPEPQLPADLPPAELDRDAKAELRSLPTTLAERVGAHLVAAGALLDDEPERAHAHAWYARSLAPRLALVREAAGLTAYRTGDYAAALSELRAVRRMTGDPQHLPVMADAERGLGRPERALALSRDPDVRRLEPAARVEMAIVASGARRDRGEYDAAVVALQGPALDSERIQPWTARLWYAYADALLAAGRREEALRWFDAAAAIDDDGETDADDRADELRAGG